MCLLDEGIGNAVPWKVDKVGKMVGVTTTVRLSFGPGHHTHLHKVMPEKRCTPLEFVVSVTLVLRLVPGAFRYGQDLICLDVS